MALPLGSHFALCFYPDDGAHAPEFTTFQRLILTKFAPLVSFSFTNFERLSIFQKNILLINRNFFIQSIIHKLSPS